ncbi:universal stress protein [Burkholderia cenocepacia]
MFYDLLIPLDGTTQADRVVQLAARAASRDQSRLHVMCVVDPSYLTSPEDSQGIEPDGLAYPRANEQSKRASEIVEGAIETLKRMGFEVEGHIFGGDPFDAIIENAVRFHADLIVMGHRHLSRLQRLSTPSTVGEVLTRSPCPVLVETSSGLG